MKPALSVLFLLSCLSCLQAASLIEHKESSESFDSTESIESVKGADPCAFALEELLGKSEEELAAWLLQKRAEHDAIVAITKSDSIADFTTSSSGSNTPVDMPISPASTASTVSFSKSPEPVSENPVVDQQNALLELSEALHYKNFKEAVKILATISNWKMTHSLGNFSALSEISRYARSKFLGKLNHSDASVLFRPLLKGSNTKLAGGYISALALFHHEIQSDIMARLINSARSLRGYLLQTSIYYQLHPYVIGMLLDSGAMINIQDDHDEPTNIRGLPSNGQKCKSDLDIDIQMSVSKRFFMNFHDNKHLFASWEQQKPNDAEFKFLLGMLESAPEENGVLRAAFEKYSPKIVKSLVDLSPFVQMANYHLAHLIAKNPEKKAGYPEIETLVDQQIMRQRITNGESDLVALALVSQLHASEQYELITEFLSKTDIFTRAALSNPQTLVRDTSTEFQTETGLYELPYSPADVFFLTACKWNIDDAAFAELYKSCVNIHTRAFLIAKNSALDWAQKNNLTGKIEIMTPKKK